MVHLVHSDAWHPIRVARYGQGTKEKHQPENHPGDGLFEVFKPPQRLIWLASALPGGLPMTTVPL